jgi:hypothetical protein
VQEVVTEVVFCKAQRVFLQNAHTACVISREFIGVLPTYKLARLMHSGLQIMKSKSSLPKLANCGDLIRPTHEEITALAFKLYVENGCQEGRATEDWLFAEQCLIEQLNRPAAKKSESVEETPAVSPAPKRRTARVPAMA